MAKVPFNVRDASHRQNVRAAFTLSPSAAPATQTMMTTLLDYIDHLESGKALAGQREVEQTNQIAELMEELENAQAALNDLGRPARQKP